jgi:hypothetical protein
VTVTQVEDGHTWELGEDGFRLDGRWCANSRVPEDVAHHLIMERRHAIMREGGAARYEATTRRREEAVDRAHDEALDVDYVVSSYVPGTNPRMFRVAVTHPAVDGPFEAVVDAGLFALECAAKFSWRGSPATLYLRVNRVLVEAGHRLKEKAKRRAGERTEEGTCHVPASMEAA